MSHKLVIKEEAQEDIAIAYDYYEAQQQGLGDRFLSALGQRLHDISLNPEYYSYIAADNRKLLRDVV